MMGESYKLQLEKMHQSGHFNNGKNAYRIVEDILKTIEFESLLDFGCGQGALLDEIKKNYPNKKLYGYDPGYEKFKIFPENKFDLVISTDALEHIEPEHLDQTLIELDKRIGNYAFLRIACYPAVKKLPDGRNAHLIVKPPEWWRAKIISTLSVNIESEKILKVDKTDRWSWVIGFNYDVVIKRKQKNIGLLRAIRLSLSKLVNVYSR